jgi:hypothetical protein
VFGGIGVMGCDSLFLGMTTVVVRFESGFRVGGYMRYVIPRSSE